MSFQFVLILSLFCYPNHKLKKHLFFFFFSHLFSGCLVLGGTTTSHDPMKKESLRLLMASAPLSSEPFWWECCSISLSTYTLTSPCTVSLLPFSPSYFPDLYTPILFSLLSLGLSEFSVLLKHRLHLSMFCSLPYSPPTHLPPSWCLSIPTTSLLLCPCSFAARSLFLSPPCYVLCLMCRSPTAVPLDCVNPENV